MRKYRSYTNNDIIIGASQVKSLAGLLRFLGLKQAGGNFSNMKRKLQQLKVDCSHWTGQGWNKDQQLKNWSEYTKVKGLKKHLIKLKGNICECCKNSLWLNYPIKLEVHHKDSNRTNNEIINLELLCPNCHSFTDGFRNRKSN